MQAMGEEWSQWLDFVRSNIEALPESPGVFVMHANMKVLYIGGSTNIRQGLADRLSDECSASAKRFRYIFTQSPEAVRDSLLKEYAEKHQGKLPLCNHI